MWLRNVYWSEQMGVQQSSFRRMYLFIEGSPEVYVDIVRSGKKLLQVHFDDKYKNPPPIRYAHFNLRDIKDHPDVMFYGDNYNFITLNWEDNLLDEEETTRILRNFVGVKRARKVGVFFIFNTSGSLEDYFRNESIVPKGDMRIVRCKPGIEISKFIRCRIWASDFDMDEKIAKELADVPFKSLFNIFKIIEYAGLDYVNMSDANRLDLLRDSFEYRVARQLIEKGRQQVLNRIDLHLIEPQRFFAHVQRFLETFVWMRAVRDDKRWGEQKSELKVEYSKMQFLSNLDKKIADHDLRKWYYLCLRLSLWSSQPYSHLLLLYYW
jgi:hypothetical protein